MREKVEQSYNYGEKVLISTSNQQKGVGRQGKSWTHFENSLAFSLSFKPHLKASVTPLEVGALLVKYLKSIGHNLYLKWPNDLINSKKQKCGGILCTFINSNLVLVGIGLNWGKADYVPQNDSDILPGAIEFNSKLSREEQQTIPHNIASFLYANRLSSEEVSNTWRQFCCHYEKKVSLLDGTQTVSGIFKGIGPGGEALIAHKGKIQMFTTGSIVLLETV